MEKREYSLMYKIEESHWWFKGKRKIVFSHLEKFIQGKKNLKILDMGCGTGMMMKKFQRYGAVFGIDIETTALDLCAERNMDNIAQADILKLPFKPNSFDVVGIFDVLYHKGVKNDVSALKEIFRVLKPNGLLILTDSADMKLWGRHDIAAHARERYTIPKLSERLVLAGFKIKKITYFNTILYPLIFTVRRIDNLLNQNKKAVSDIKPSNQLLNFVLYAMFIIESKLLKMFNLPFGVSILAISEKAK